MSDVDPTPDTPTTIGDRLQWFRADLDARLDALRGPAGEGSAAPRNTLSEIWSAISNIEATLDANWPLMMSKLASIDDRLASLEMAIGAGDYASLELASVRGLLWGILTGQQAYGISPGDTTGTSYRQSTSSYSEGGMRFVVWGGDISGVTKSANNIQLTPVSSWNGYSVYIQTDAPNAYMDDFTAPEQSSPSFPVNSWVSLDSMSNHTLIFRVGASYQVRGYLRVPLYEYTTVPVPGYPNWYQVLDFAPLPYYNNDPSSTAQNLTGWTIELLSGTSPIRIMRADTGETLQIVPSLSTATITASSTTGFQMGATVNVDGAGPVTLHLTPP